MFPITLPTVTEYRRTKKMIALNSIKQISILKAIMREQLLSLPKRETRRGASTEIKEMSLFCACSPSMRLLPVTFSAPVDLCMISDIIQSVIDQPVYVYSVTKHRQVDLQ